MENNKLQVFENEEFGRLEILVIDDKPYFPATDCAKVLGYSNPRKAILDHCKGVTKCDSLSSGGRQGKNYIPEGDLYRLIIRSKLPAAEKFERWVFDEVLPSIRKHGAYITEEALDAAVMSQDFAFDLFQQLLAEQGKNTALINKVEALAPKARYCDLILQCQTTMPVSIIAKDYGFSATAFNRLLHALRIQYRCGKTWLLYQCFARQGYTQSRTYYAADGTAVVNTHWTQKGRLFLYDALHREGIVPLIEQYDEDDFDLDFFDDFDYEEAL